MIQADRILLNANVITLDAQDTIAKAIALKNGKILAVGDNPTIEAYKDSTTVIDNLHGKTIIPGFIDAHSHFSLIAAQQFAADLSGPPLGEVNSIPALIASLISYKNTYAIGPETWIIGMGYDNNAFANVQHPTAHDLDQVSQDNPIIIFHSSFHSAVLNAKALKRANIGEDTKNPEGGQIGRYQGSKKPNGVLEERALDLILPRLPLPKLEEAKKLIKKAAELYAAHGITTAQDGFAVPRTLALLHQVAASEKLPLDLVAYSYCSPQTNLANLVGHTNYINGLKVGGVKLILDGSIQGYTAYLKDPYFVQPANRVQENKTYRGYPAYTNIKDLEALLLDGLKNSWQILAHANGDAAIDQFIQAMKNCLDQYRAENHRTVIIHAQVMHENQLKQARELGMRPSFFPGHIYYWGDLHRDVFLGPERAQHIDPCGWAIKQKIGFTLHHDAPVTPLNMIDLLHFAVNRKTMSGQVLGPDQRISALDALKALTVHAAWQYFEEESKGTIEVGKNADLVVLSDNPLTIKSEDLRKIEVMQTIKNGKTSYFSV